MENIRQAVERAKARQGRIPGRHQTKVAQSSNEPPKILPALDGSVREVVLDEPLLQSNRIIAHLSNDPRAKSFDMLRTQVLQSMDQRGWNLLAVTSPKPNCGKTVTAINLALSIARQPERSVLLVDLDFQKPQVAKALGLKLQNNGAVGVIGGLTTLSDAVLRARVGDQRFLVLPTTRTSGSAELMASRAMTVVLESLKRGHASQTVILDLPPVLTSDDAISILPQIDCLLLITAVGLSTIADIKECGHHLQSTEVVRIVVNKVPESHTNYRYY